MGLKLPYSLFVEILNGVLVNREWLDSRHINVVLCYSELRAHKTHLGPLLLLFFSLFLVQGHAHLLSLLDYCSDVLAFFGGAARARLALLSLVTSDVGQTKLWVP